jgi:hypothetical protein
MPSPRAEERLNSYRTAAVLPESFLNEWSLHLTARPYTRADELSTFAQIPNSRSALGPILIATPCSRAPDPERCTQHLDALRAAFPSGAVVVRVPPNGMEDTTLSAFFVRLSRHGAVVVPATMTEPGRFRAAVLASYDLRTDLLIYLRAVLPRWPEDAQQAARRMFIRGFEYDPEELPDIEHLPRKHPVWMQVGRAISAAVVIQRQSTPVLSRAAARSHYSDSTSMNRSLLRAFGVTAHDISGTGGWEWLLWRFLLGLGKGKARNWDD